VLRNIELAHGFGQGHEDRMFRRALVAGVEFLLPLVQQFE
jgi:hypothetical protein